MPGTYAEERPEAGVEAALAQFNQRLAKVRVKDVQVILIQRQPFIVLYSIIPSGVEHYTRFPLLIGE